LASGGVDPRRLDSTARTSPLLAIEEKDHGTFTFPPERGRRKRGSAGPGPEARPSAAEPGRLDPLLERIGDARYVLLGEASHGTAEYYTWRAALSKRLIVEKGFSFLAVEGDWPDCYRINRHVKGLPDAGDHPRDVLATSGAGRPGCGPTRRWPT